jgi:hypothetical protein
LWFHGLLVGPRFGQSVMRFYLTAGNTQHCSGRFI